MESLHYRKNSTSTPLQPQTAKFLRISAPTDTSAEPPILFRKKLRLNHTYASRCRWTKTDIGNVLNSATLDLLRLCTLKKRTKFGRPKKENFCYRPPVILIFCHRIAHVMEVVNTLSHGKIRRVVTHLRGVKVQKVDFLDRHCERTAWPFWSGARMVH